MSLRLQLVDILIPCKGACLRMKPKEQKASEVKKEAERERRGGTPICSGSFVLPSGYVCVYIYIYIFFFFFLRHKTFSAEVSVNPVFCYLDQVLNSIYSKSYLCFDSGKTTVCSQAQIKLFSGNYLLKFKTEWEFDSHFKRNSVQVNQHTECLLVQPYVKRWPRGVVWYT